MMQTFSEWIVEEIQRRGWTEAEFARRGKITPQSVNQMLNGRTKPAMRFYKATAKAFELPLEDVLRRAGQLQPLPSAAITDDLIARLRRLPAEDQDKVLAMWRLSIETLEQIRGLAPPARDA